MEKTNRFKSGFVTLIGRPNVGKSTLMNRLIGQKIAITSHKPQTTRNRIRTVYTCEQGQIVFVDTPGLHRAKDKLGNYMVSAAMSALQDVDLVLWLVEAADFVGPGDQRIAKQLQQCRTPVILVINKSDLVSHDQMFSIIDRFKDLCDFAEVIPLSALKGKNTEELLSLIFRYLPYGEPFYDEDTVTDQPERQIVSEMIREKALKCLNDEIPHGIAVVIERMQFTPKIVHIDATIVCERDSHKGIIIGKGGAMLKKIGSAARFEIERLLETQVNLHLFVKVKKDWRDSDFHLKNFGYDQREISEE